MNLKNAPQKIKNDGLVNVIVELSLIPDYSKIKLERLLEERYREEGKPLAKYVIKNRKSTSPVDENLYFFSNQIFKLKIEENALLFNIVDNYPGWAEMSGFIRQVLAVMPELHYNQVSVQFVSMFKDILIFDQLDGTIALPHIDKFIGSELSFRYAHEEKGTGVALVDVKLVNNMVDPPKDNHFSVVDVKSFCNGNGQWTNEEMLSRLDLVHKVENRCFFSLMKEEFINSREPIYE